MTNVLIITCAGDFHSMAVQWGLEQLGANVGLWIPADLPDRAKITISDVHCTDNIKVAVRFENEIITLNHFDVAWNRRRGSPKAPEYTAAADSSAIEVECNAHITNAMHILNMSVPMVNSLSSQFIADNKLVQLNIASKVGFSIPKTVSSNNFDDIEQFQHSNGGCIFKPYKPHVWTNEIERFSQLTSKLPALESVNPKSIEACPIIVQEFLVREYEVRVTLFGDHVIAMKVAGRSADGHLDSRYELNVNTPHAEAIELPYDIVRKCKKYMDLLDLSFGAFDLLVDNEGKWYFLECNEAGQFLFQEHYDPGLRVLDKFCKWLIGFGEHSDWRMKREISLSEFYESESFKHLSQSHKLHKNPANNLTFHEEINVI